MGNWQESGVYRYMYALGTNLAICTFQTGMVTLRVGSSITKQQSQPNQWVYGEGGRRGREGREGEWDAGLPDWGGHPLLYLSLPPAGYFPPW